MKEILTLQFGTASNYVGAHFWNLQNELFSSADFQESSTSEIDPTILYRCSDSNITPRMVSFEAKGNLGYLNTTNPKSVSKRSDAQTPTSSHAWGGQVQCIESDIHPRNQYTQHLIDQENIKGTENSVDVEMEEEKFYIDNDINVWSDFLTSNYHHRSNFEISEFHNFDQLHNFAEGIPGCGNISRTTKDDAWDQVRFFLEECDNIQGAHCLVDIDSSYGGFSKEIISELKEECRSCNIVSFGLDAMYPLSRNCHQEIDPLKQRSRSIINNSLSSHFLVNNSDIYIPVSLNNDHDEISNYQIDNLFHSSAIAALGIEVVTSSYRRRKGHDLGDFIRQVKIAGSSKNITEIAVDFPYTMLKDQENNFTRIKDLPNNCGLFPQISPVSKVQDKKVEVELKVDNQYVTIRNCNSECMNISQVNDAIVKSFALDNANVGLNTSQVNMGILLPKTFPNFVLKTGSCGIPMALNTVGSTVTSNHIHTYMRAMSHELKNVDRRLMYEYNQLGVETDDFQEICSSLNRIKDDYC